MSRTFILAASLLVTPASLFAPAALAGPGEDSVPVVDFVEACSMACVSGGFEITVYEAVGVQAYMLQLVPTDGQYYSSVPIGAGAEWITDQTDVIDGGYCDQSGFYIVGDVYLNTFTSPYNSHTTPQLNGYSPCTSAGGFTSIDNVLTAIEDNTTSPEVEVPSFCGDMDCLVPDGVEEEPVDDDVFVHTDASEQSMPFDWIEESADEDEGHSPTDGGDSSDDSGERPKESGSGR